MVELGSVSSSAVGVWYDNLASSSLLKPLFDNGLTRFELFGNDLGHYVFSLILIILTIYITRFFYNVVLKTYVKRLTQKTKTNLDDILLEISEGPLVALVTVIGLQFSVSALHLPEGLIATVSSISFIFIAVWFILRLIDEMFEHYIEDHFAKRKSSLDENLLPVIQKILKVFVGFCGVITVLMSFGYDVTALLGSVGILGLAVGMAAKDTIGNFLASLSLFGDKPFEIGELVSVKGYTGVVKEVGLRSTRIQTADGTIIVIPNQDVANSPVENLSIHKTKGVSLTLKLDYSNSSQKIEKAKSILMHVVKHVEEIDKDSVAVCLNNLSETAIELTLSYSVPDASKVIEIKDRVHTHIIQEFEKNKIKFANPSMPRKV